MSRFAAGSFHFVGLEYYCSYDYRRRNRNLESGLGGSLTDGGGATGGSQRQHDLSPAARRAKFWQS